MMAVGAPTAGHDSPRRQTERRVRRLAHITIGWTGVEAVVGVWAAVAAGSLALLAFGVDSLIEVVSGAAVLWRFSGTQGDTRERRAALIVGSSLVLLGVFVAVDGVVALVQHREPRVSSPGIVLTAITVLLMPVLARLKRRAAAETQSQALVGDARQSDICAWLSAITLAGLGLRGGLGWWWADPAAALALVPLIIWEGVAVLRGESSCADCAAPSMNGVHSVDDG